MIHCVVAAGCKFRVAKPFGTDFTAEWRPAATISALVFYSRHFAHAVYPPAYLSVCANHTDVRKNIVSHFENWKLFAKVDATGALLKRNNKCFVKKLLSL